MPLLTLPRELRNTIYDCYVFEADGYHFDFASGKLRASGNRPIDLALMYTCKSVAAEMHHVALGKNVVHFSTIGSDSERERSMAGHFNIFFRELYLYKSAVLRSLAEPIFRHYATPDLDAKVALRYPQFIHLIHHAPDLAQKEPLGRYPDYKWCSSWGEADSVFRGFQDYLLELLSKDTDFPEALAEFYDDRGPGGPERRDRLESNPFDRTLHSGPHSWRERASFLRSPRLLSSPDPWSIPSDHELAQMSTIHSPSFPEYNFWKRLRWRFSAAAAAIHFFKSIPQSTCLAVRNVVLHEDRRSVAYPECHALGLIPFCLKNPQLHIERRVNMWRTLMTTEPIENQFDVGHWVQGLETSVLEQILANYLDMDNVQSNLSIIGFGIPFGKWITEASVLSAKGMPIHSFSLVFDGDPAPDQCLALFEVVKLCAAWQVAQAQWYAEISVNPSIIRMRYNRIYMSEVFPQAVSDIIQGKSFISCDFPMGEMYDPKQVLDRCRHLSPYGHPTDLDTIRTDEFSAPGARWIRERHKCFMDARPRPLPPLPSKFCDLALEEVMPE